MIDLAATLVKAKQLLRADARMAGFTDDTALLAMKLAILPFLGKAISHPGTPPGDKETLRAWCAEIKAELAGLER